MPASVASLQGPCADDGLYTAHRSLHLLPRQRLLVHLEGGNTGFKSLMLVFTDVGIFLPRRQKKLMCKMPQKYRRAWQAYRSLEDGDVRVRE